MKKFLLYSTEENYNNENVKIGKTDSSFLGKDNEHQKCLPFKIAGELGWDLTLPESYEIYWNGGDNKKDITIKAPNKTDFISSSLGYGIITFKIPYLFQLEKDTFLWIKGGGNNPLSLDLYACEGVVEADWFPSHITMNYKIVTKDKWISLDKGKSYCRLVPYPKNYIENFIPTHSNMKEDKSFFKRYITYNHYNRFIPFAKTYLTSYIKGMIGKEKVKNVPKIKLSSFTEAPSKQSKCPFHKLFKK